MILLTLDRDPQCGYGLTAKPSAYSKAVRDNMRGWPGVRWDRQLGLYKGPEDVVVQAVRQLEAARVIRLAKPLPPRGVDGQMSDACQLVRWADTLRDYQYGGAEFVGDQLQRTGGALLADDMGLGKTLQTIAALEATLQGNAFVQVVCPAVVLPHWQAQIQQWCRRKDLRWDFSSYAKLSRLVREDYERPHCLVLDEIHYLSNPKSQRSKAARQLRSDSTWCLGLSGTPMTTTPIKLWHPLDLLWPGRFGTWWQFGKRYCDGHYEEIPIGEAMQRVWKTDGACREEELAERLKYCMLRRTKSDVALELPAMQRVIVDVPLSTSAKACARRAAAAISADEPSAGLAAAISSYEHHKSRSAVQLAQDAIANGSRPLVLTTRKSVAGEIAHALDCPIATGDVPPTKRRDTLLQGSAGVSTVYAVTTGIDLTEFDVVIFVGLDWVPSTLLQAEARTHRIGQERKVTVYYLIATGTLDEVIQNRVINRLTAFEKIAGSDDGLAKDLGGGEESDLIASILEECK